MKEGAEEVPGTNDFVDGYDAMFAKRRSEADEFYDSRIPRELSADARLVMRQAYSGMLWSKQFYPLTTFMPGSQAILPDPRHQRRALEGRNKDWSHLYNDDIISMPDKWEYPWYAAWDLAFHCVPPSHRRSGLRQGSTDPSASRMVHASKRAITCLRVGLRGCKILLCTPGPPGASIKLSAACVASRTAPFSSASSTNYFSISPGG